MHEKHVIGPFKYELPEHYEKATLEIYGIEHYRPSFTVVVCLNDPEVEPQTCGKETKSYAGRFSIFGHAECAGDEGHCDVSYVRRRFDDRPSHPLTKAFRRIPITEPLQKACKGNKELTLTLVASCDVEYDDFEGDRLLDYSGIQIVTQ